jgi:outer membrane protein OmpA-like peptidoglycan-associated protein
MGLKPFFLMLICGIFPFGKLFSQDFVEIQLIDSISVSFDSGSSLIRNPAKLIARLNETKIGSGKIQLIAYTDTVGSIGSNKNLASKRLLAVLKLIDSTKIKSFILDTVNQNEGRRGTYYHDASYRRVDILLFSIVPKVKFDVPINLRINFHPASTNFVKNSIKNVEMLQVLMEMDTTLRVKLHGHVCCHPDLILSLYRAEKVKSYLVDHGINANRISCNGYSNTIKLVPETTEGNKEKNRRVEVIFIK